MENAPTLEDSPDAWLVYADELQQAGDPRGELIALVHAGAAADVRAYVQNNPSVLGPAASHRQHLTIEWRWCLVDHLTMRLDAEAIAQFGGSIVKRVVTAPAFSQLRSFALVIESSDGQRVDASAATLALSALPPSCRSLTVADARAQAATMLVAGEFFVESQVSFGPLAPIAAIDHVRTLEFEVAVADELDFADFHAPALERLAIRSLLFESPRTTLVNARLPGLRELELRLGETFVANIPAQVRPYVAIDSYPEFNEDDGDWREFDEWGEHEEGPMGADWQAELGPVLAAVRQAPLVRLDLTSFESAQSLLETLASVGLPSTLKHLGFAHSGLRADAVDWLLEHRALFADLENLDLRETALTAEDAARLAGLGPDIEHSCDERAPRFRFVAGQE